MVTYAEIKPSYTNVTRYRKTNDFIGIYNLIKQIVLFEDEEPSLIADEAAYWCETHSVGETYEHKLFSIRILEDEE